MKIECMYYGKHWNKKPIEWEIAEVQNNLSQSEITIEQLADNLSHGASFKPAVLTSLKSESWQQQQLFALDFDNDVKFKNNTDPRAKITWDKSISPEEQCKRDNCHIIEDCRTTIEAEIARCEKHSIHPVFGYYSFSSSATQPKFRLVFCNHTVITDLEIRNKLQNTLIAVFDKSDKVTFNPDRLFFGGKELIQADFNNRIDAEKIIDTYYNLVKISVEQKKNSKGKTLKQDNKKSLIKVFAPLPQDANMALKIEAIKALNTNVMKTLLKIDSNATTVCYSQKDLYAKINSISLSDYLGVYDYVSCILPDHEDSTPSAHIYITDDGTEIYKCFGCNKARTIIGMTEELSGCKRSEAIEFIKAVYNIRLEQSEWVQQQKQNMIDCANYIDTDEFKLEFPVLSSLISTRKSHIQLMLKHFAKYLSDDMKIDGKPFFFASYKTLMDVCRINPNKRDNLSKSLALFSLLNMIEKLPLDKIPEKELTKAKHIAAKYKQKKITNFYSFEEYGVNTFNKSEERAKILKENNMTLKGLSREYVLRTFGTDVANAIYPQYKSENKKGTSEKSNEHTLHITECVFYLLDEKNYATEKDIVHLLGRNYNYQSTETQIKKSLQELLLSYGLLRVKASKANKEKYKIPEYVNYQSYVICRDSMN